MFLAKPCIALAAVLLAAPLVCAADQYDPRLDALFLQLRQTEEQQVADYIEREIWNIWLQHANGPAEERLAQGIVAMETDPLEALLIFNEVISGYPDFAEGWNKRATLYYLFGDYTASERDIERTLALEPRHFGALSGLGLVYLAQHEYQKARSAFEAVLSIHPHSSGVRRNIRLIDQYMRRSTI